MNSTRGLAGSRIDLAVITDDPKLSRVMGGDDLACAVELWVLQLQILGAIESRLLYGRVSPSSFSNARWSSLAEDHFKVVREGCSAQCVRLTLYCPAKSVRGLLEVMTTGATLTDASKSVGVSMPADFEKRFGELTLLQPLAVRPPMHLPTRDYYRWYTNKISPLSCCSCDSASISNLAKSDLFSVGIGEDRELASFAIDLLSADTGLEFAGVDSWRLGDLELLVFPGLTEQGGSLVHLENTSDGICVQLDRPLAAGADLFRIQARLLNDDAVFHTVFKVIAADAPYPTTVNLDWPPKLAQIRDAFTLEVEAQNSKSGTSWLCYQWGTPIIREARQTMHFDGSQAILRNDWLSKALRPSHMSRLDEAQQISRQKRGTEAVIGGRQADPWVAANRHVTMTIKSLVPPKSNGCFFLRYSEGENTGRLELAEWIKRLLEDHRDKHIAWFDPYMEDIGIHLLNQYGSDSAAYTVFTGAGRGKSTPQWWHVDARMRGDEQPEVIPDRRIQNLQAACKDWAMRYGTIRLQVFGLQQDELHDRMVLVRDALMRPVVGYHLSNSLQKANENYPLLITPIPADVLQRVLDYSDQLLRSSASQVEGQGKGGVRLRCLFDSDTEKDVATPHIRVDVLDTPRCGEILDWWLSSSELAGEYAQGLRHKLDARGLLRDGQLHGDVFESLPAGMWEDGLKIADFNTAWDALAAVLSNTRAGDFVYEAPDVSVPPLRDALLRYLDSDRTDAVPPPERKHVLDMTVELSRSLTEFMKWGEEPQRRFPYDVNEVSWGDYYALKVLWATDPADLVAWVEDGALARFNANLRRQLGLKCAARMISFEISRSCSPRQLEALLKSANGLLRWIGYVAFESIAHDDPKALSLSGWTSLLTSTERLDLLGWLAARAAFSDQRFRQVVINELHASLPEKLDDAALKRAVDSMRNTLGKVHDSTPWILQEVLLPLVNTRRLEVDAVARLWFDELFECWAEPDTTSIFRIDIEGQFTDEVAKLCAVASASESKAVLAKVSKAVANHARVVQRPFSAQLKWSAYDDAFQMLLWVSGFLWAWLGQSQRPSQIEKVLQPAEAALARRSERDWEKSSSARLLGFRKFHLRTTLEEMSPRLKIDLGE